MIAWVVQNVFVIILYVSVIILYVSIKLFWKFCILSLLNQFYIFISRNNSVKELTAFANNANAVKRMYINYFHSTGSKPSTFSEETPPMLVGSSSTSSSAHISLSPLNASSLYLRRHGSQS